MTKIAIKLLFYTALFWPNPIYIIVGKINQVAKAGLTECKIHLRKEMMRNIRKCTYSDRIHTFNSISFRKMHLRHIETLDYEIQIMIFNLKNH